MEEIKRWYSDISYSELKEFIKESIANMSREFVAVGYYLKYVRDNEMYLEDGYASIWEFAEDLYGIRRSTCSRWMAINDRFSNQGNSPTMDDRYRQYGKSQLQEMLYLDDEQIEEVTPDMTVKEIREIRKSEQVPEVVDVPEIKEPDPEEQISGQMSVEDFPEILPGQDDGPEKCITGKSGSGICGAAAYCSTGYNCCAECDQSCNSRCGWLDDMCDVAHDETTEPVEDVVIDLVVKEGSERPKLPNLKNNDQRKNWLNNYKGWGLWYHDDYIDVNYYKYDFDDGSRLVVAEYPQREHEWSWEPCDEHYYHLLEKNRKKAGSTGETYDRQYMQSTDSETYLMEFLKNLQRGKNR
jgi:hypothetical protein|nr:MAG TPA_asm: Protein of unknown function (DUF3102) [Caudoviricetes sp.]